MSTLHSPTPPTWSPVEPWAVFFFVRSSFPSSAVTAVVHVYFDLCCSIQCHTEHGRVCEPSGVAPNNLVAVAGASAPSPIFRLAMHGAVLLQRTLAQGSKHVKGPQPLARCTEQCCCNAH
jgi:hypothetical protein